MNALYDNFRSVRDAMSSAMIEWERNHAALSSFASIHGVDIVVDLQQQQQQRQSRDVARGSNDDSSAAGNGERAAVANDTERRRSEVVEQDFHFDGTDKHSDDDDDDDARANETVETRRARMALRADERRLKGFACVCVCVRELF